jgi:hypothetical protein
MELLAAEVQALLRDGDSFAVFELIQRQGTPIEIADRYQSLIKDLYWKAHDLPAVVIIGRAGIMYCLSQSSAAEVSSESVEKLRSAAKALAYNAGSFIWPGWEEPGISPRPEDLAFARDCAQLNLRLAVELGKPPTAVSAAHWLIGAHALAARDFELAEREFQRAQDVLPIGDETEKAMNGGYLAVARLAKNASDASAQAGFEHIASMLRAHEDKEAQGYLSQLLSARRLFVPPK